MKKLWAPAACLFAALFMVLPVAARDGWPYNHEYSAPFERVEAFRRAFLALDFFPTWTPFCFNGHGTPSPFVYHRLFNGVAGLLAVPLGTSVGTRCALVLFAWLGAWGLFRVARRLEIGPLISFSIAAAFIWAPYSLTDWLVRGSAAEFASMMLLPWLLEALVRQLQADRVWLSLGLSLAAAMHAHQALGLYLAPLPVLSTLFALVLARGHRVAVLVDALKAAALGLALTLPWLIPVFRVGGAFRLDTLKIYVPWAQLVPWNRYVIDETFLWGRTFQGFSVELSHALLLAGALAVAASLIAGAKVRNARVMVFLGLAFLGAWFLQFEAATPVYQRVPRAELLQFPWRLLGVMTPIACLLLAMVLDAVARQGRLWSSLAAVVALGVAAQHAALVRTAQAVAYQRFDRAGLDQRLVELDGPWSAAEYLPRAIPGQAVPERSPWVQVSGCEVRSISPAAPSHFRKIDVALAAGPSCRVTFSQFDTPVLSVEGDGARVVGAPFVTVDVPAGGERKVTLRRRNLLELWWP